LGFAPPRVLLCGVLPFEVLQPLHSAVQILKMARAARFKVNWGRAGAFAAPSFVVSSIPGVKSGLPWENTARVPWFAGM